ncbi:MAG: histidine phosphatase family protein [Salaquimonas sp.]
MIFLRHPKPEIEPGICYGRTDLDIAEIGHGQIAKAVATTPKFTRIVASPALRCRKLALSLGEREGIEVSFDERLWEMHMGDWEGMAWKNIDRKASEHWLEDPVHRPTPNGEAFIDVQRRVAEAISDLMDNEAQSTVVVCHAGPIRATQMDWESLSFSEVFALTPPYSEPMRILHPDWR